MALTDIASGRVIQRTSKAAATGNVPVVVPFTGTTPTSMEARVMKGGNVIVPWTAVSAFSIVGSEARGTLINVPQGDGYTLQARTKNGSTILATETGTNVWGIGRNFIFGGSSILSRWFTDTTAEGASALARSYTSSWAAVTGAGAIAFSNLIIQAEPGVDQL